MVTAALWGLVQGLTEFLPISSSGHLVLIPAIFGLDEPGLATSAVLHLGTLAAIVAFYRRDLARLVSRPLAAENHSMWLLLALGSIPAAVFGLAFDGPIEVIFSEPWIVAVSLVFTGLVLFGASYLVEGPRRMEEGRAPDAVVVGLAQALALLPGISRSGMTITGGLAQGFTREEAARYAFLLGVPAIAGAGITEGIDLARTGGFEASLLVGAAVAAVSGYLAIGGLVRALERFGLKPFAGYCVLFGTFAYFLV